jgi:hypothetical protein
MMVIIIILRKMRGWWKKKGRSGCAVFEVVYAMLLQVVEDFVRDTLHMRKIFL